MVEEHYHSLEEALAPRLPSTDPARVPSWIRSGLVFGLNLLPGLGLIVAGLMVDTLVQPHHTPVDSYKDGPPITQPLVPASISIQMLYIISWIVPLLFVLLLSAVRRDLGLLRSGLLSLTETCGYTLLLTTVLKKLGGSLRPNFIAYCQWDGAKCNAPDIIVMSAYQSFPSGHASSSAGGMLFLALFLYATLKPNLHSPLVRAFCFGPTIVVAFYVAMTRIWEHYHRFEDVSMGMGLGAAIAFGVFGCHDVGVRASVIEREEGMTWQDMERERNKTLRMQQFV